ncbi:MAG TPA: hypothetical protein VIY52_06075 [Streptosporangiaceae bacterium]
MAVAMIGRPSWPYRPARGRDPGDLARPDQAQGQGPAQAVIGEMAWLLRDTRSGLFLGGIVLSAITVGIALEAAFSGRIVQPSVVGAMNVGLLCGLLFCWLTAVVMLARAGRPVHNALSELRWRTGAPLDPGAVWLTLPPAERDPEEWAWTRAHLLLGAARMTRCRIQLADTWTYVTAAFFLIWTALVLLGL